MVDPSLCFCALLVVAQAVPNRIEEQRPLLAESGSSYFDSAFDKYVEDTLDAYKVPGFSIAVIDGNDVHSKGYGYATLPDVKATADTQYFTGSTTKAFVAAAAGQLVHNDSYPDMHWTSRISPFLREDFLLENEFTGTTIEDALSHRSGLPRHDWTYGLPDDTPSSVVQRMRYLPLTAEPRTKWQYCNLMYAVMTDLLEKVTGSSLEEHLHDKLWAPLGMSSTRFTIPSVEEHSKLARGYHWHGSSSSGRHIPEPYIDLLPLSGAGATISTVKDYSLWIKAFLSAARSDVNTSSPISSALFKDLVTPRSIVGDDGAFTQSFGFASPSLYALGWMNTRLSSGEIVIGHGGDVTGFEAAVYMLPKYNYGIVMMANSQKARVPEAMIGAKLLQHKVKTMRSEVDIISTSVEDTDVLLSMLQSSSSRSQKVAAVNKDTYHVAELPLPGAIDDFAGLYSHPGYGVINLTVVGPAELEAYLYPRTWPHKLNIKHYTDTVFSMEMSTPHGIGDIRSKDIVWEKVEDGIDRRADFKFGLDGETVETMGMELEDSMIEAAREKGDKAWKDGMIWFEKV